MQLATRTIPGYFGKDPAELIGRLEVIKDSRVDVLASQGRMRFVATDDGLALQIWTGDDEALTLVATDHALDQIAEKMGIPVKYFGRCGSEIPALLLENVNSWLRHSPSTNRLVRGLRVPANAAPEVSEDGVGSPEDTITLRAFLSDRYRILDHADVALTALETATETLREGGFGSPDCFGWNLSETSLDLVLGAPGLVADLAVDEIAGDTVVDHGKGGTSGVGDKRVEQHSGDTRGTMQASSLDVSQGGSYRMMTADGNQGDGGEGSDLVFAAARIRNSETGDGGLWVRPMALRNCCNNRLMLGFSMTQIHLGRTLNEDLVASPATRQAENEVVYMKVRDAIAAVFTPETFQALVDRIRETKAIEIVKPAAAIGIIAEKAGMTDKRKDSILAAYKREANPEVDTVFDVVQALTLAAHDDRETAPEAALEIEEIAAKIMEKPPAAILATVS